MRPHAECMACLKRCLCLIPALLAQMSKEMSELEPIAALPGMNWCPFCWTELNLAKLVWSLAHAAWGSGPPPSGMSSAPQAPTFTFSGDTAPFELKRCTQRSRSCWKARA